MGHSRLLENHATILCRLVRGRLRWVRCELCQRRYLSRYWIVVHDRRLGHCAGCRKIVTVGVRVRSGARSSTRILLIDDDSHIRRVLTAILARPGTGTSVIHEATDGLEALELALRLQPRVVVCDSSMKFGEDLGPRLRAILPNSRIISFSGTFAERPWADAVIEKGSDQDIERVEHAAFRDDSSS